MPWPSPGRWASPWPWTTGRKAGRGTSGCRDRGSGPSRATILLRPEPRFERRQWAVAHEIGEHVACRVFALWGVDPRETQANAREHVANNLAGRLLLPTAWFAADAVACGWDLLGLKARYRTASHELIARRMLECRPPVIDQHLRPPADFVPSQQSAGPSAAAFAGRNGVLAPDSPTLLAVADRAGRRPHSGMADPRRGMEAGDSADGNRGMGRRLRGIRLAPWPRGGLDNGCGLNPPVCGTCGQFSSATYWRFPALQLTRHRDEDILSMPEHSVSASQLDAVFHPKSIAVVGASTRPGTVGNDIFRNLIYAEFNGSVYPVNPKATSILGVHAYPSLADVPAAIDLAVLIVPAKSILGVVDEAIAKGVKALVVISAGFKEVGNEGAALEAKLRDKVRAAGIPLIGPNCLGVINTDPDVSMNAAFGRKMPDHGNLAFISQSGALCTSVLDYAEERQMGFSKFISFGNKADVNEIDLLAYLAKDEKTSVIAMYLEDVTQRAAVHRDGPRHLLGDPQADVVPEVGPLARRAPRPSAATPARWPVPIRSTTPCWPKAACSGSRRSPNCSTTRPFTPRSPCLAADASPSSPTPAGRASWPPTPPCATA